MTKSVCFIGHRKIVCSLKLKSEIYTLAENLILSGTVNFIFGGQSEFNDLCYDIITELKAKYPQILRIHFRTNYENANDYTMQFLIKGYEKSYCPPNISKAGRATYIKRNESMINESDICVFYYNKNYSLQKPDKTNSGTEIAYDYAVKKRKNIINLFDANVIE